MKKLSILIALLFTILLIGCSGVQVTNQIPEKRVVKLAQAAAVLFAANNATEVAAVLPYVKEALAVAKDGKISQGDITSLMTAISEKTNDKDVKTAMSLLYIELSGIEITGNGVINPEVVEALEAVMTGIEAGAAI